MRGVTAVPKQQVISQRCCTGAAWRRLYSLKVTSDGNLQRLCSVLYLSSDVGGGLMSHLSTEQLVQHNEAQYSSIRLQEPYEPTFLRAACVSRREKIEIALRLEHIYFNFKKIHSLNQLRSFKN